MEKFNIQQSGTKHGITQLLRRQIQIVSRNMKCRITEHTTSITDAILTEDGLQYISTENGLYYLKTE